MLQYISIFWDDSITILLCYLPNNINYSLIYGYVNSFIYCMCIKWKTQYIVAYKSICIN